MGVPKEGRGCQIWWFSVCHVTLRVGAASNSCGDLGRGPFSPGQVAACLLLFLEEEDAFWMMCAIIEDLLPASYFSTTLLGVQTDQRVLRHLIVQYLPRLDKLLQEHDIGKGHPSSFLGLRVLQLCLILWI